MYVGARGFIDARLPDAMHVGISYFYLFMVAEETKEGKLFWTRVWETV